MDWTLEVVVVPVRDIDASISHRDKVGFDLDHDTTNEHMDVAQLTPPLIPIEQRGRFGA